MGYEMTIRKCIADNRVFWSKIKDITTFSAKFDDVEELIDFVRDHGRNAWIQVKPNGVELIIIDPAKDLREKGHPDLE